MMLETVRIKKDNRTGYAIINKSDFDPARHVLYDAVEEIKEPEVERKRRGRKPKNAEA